MSLKDRYDFSLLKNHTEELVFEQLEKLLDNLPDEDLCKCETCILDMTCLALNKLPSRYRASLMGDIYSKVKDDELDGQVKEAVEQALSIISINPAHR
ncbi:MAG: late competence development ComFB family protein [Spirochaetaceae bacterium]|jgi:competence protein ComFB|nr:late competence development ComFB family protein [Spirochaetaceae bacterium]